ncbi:prepilin-type N-terminal cleavage/methylation domain-containing protein [Paucisalibacillus sp. EB02]|uniref:prepilin-type N-terminal cleavage/methylation domain-containing protein n=1 Tax=Paucisalibacillus sp. EB02 TaxID=1347087 RepID=UPI0005A7E420|nr:prepilin-type N-terminal cleavage/methylation domain-containing protein [Paucisalibacillus sp. EB02]
MYSKIDRHSYNGFTLIEIIASITIVSIVIIILIPIFSQILNWSERSEANLTTSNLVGQITYELKNKTNDWKEFIEGKTVNTCGHSVLFADDYKTYTLNNETYEAKLSICQEEEVDLYRVNIKLYDLSRLVTQSFTYLPVEGETNE